ncbi:MAG: prepilin-type N-terminal cleavage/methylation domain-containing protein [Bacteroidetes bacterium]|nr:prepilin-type N-terminal cleavage/methylation domain-containing protein [Bacteroidota bacterium]
MYALKNQKGFTLIELVIIIVILGILAAVAIPKYQDLSGEAREAAARSSLGSLRSGITIFYANQAVKTGSAVWPSVAEVRTSGTVMAQAVPSNPFQTAVPDSVLDGTGQIKGTVMGAAGGWVYNPTTGEIWMNSDGHSENEW